MIGKPAIAWSPHPLSTHLKELASRAAPEDLVSRMQTNCYYPPGRVQINTLKLMITGGMDLGQQKMSDLFTSHGLKMKTSNGFSDLSYQC